MVADRSIKWGAYEQRLKLAGFKLTVDGSPQGKTAFLTRPYLTPVPGCEGECRAAPVLTQRDLNATCSKLYEAGIQVYAHCNGDAAIDMMIDSHEQALRALGQASRGHERRTVIIHSQVMRPDQLEAYARLGLSPSFFTNHTDYFGDTHVANLGRARADFISPLRSALAGGIVATNHSDCPVTAIDPLFTVWSAVNRVSRSGSVIGPAQRVTPYEALQAITINAAHQYFEEASKGSLSAGKLADMVVLEKNPLEVGAAAIKDIRILKTLKEGVAVFDAAAANAAA